jgi:uncharacterized protein YxjI
MGILRNRDQPDTVRYQMREKLLSIGDDYWIEDADGHKAYKVDGKAMRIRDTWRLEDENGSEVACIRERKLSVRDAITIEAGDKKAVVKKALVGIRERYHVDVDDAPDMKAHGNFVDHEYEIEQDGDTVATVSKKWFRVRDTYGIEMDPGADRALLLGVTVAIDALAHD